MAATNETSKILSYMEVKRLLDKAKTKGVMIRFMPVKEGDFWTVLEEKDANGYGFATLKAFVDGLTYCQEGSSDTAAPTSS